MNELVKERESITEKISILTDSYNSISKRLSKSDQGNVKIMKSLTIQLDIISKELKSLKEQDSKINKQTNENLTYLFNGILAQTDSRFVQVRSCMFKGMHPSIELTFIPATEATQGLFTEEKSADTEK